MADTEKVLKTRFVLRNDTTANWSSVNPVLKKGEIGIDTTLNKFKIGDGTKAWNELIYLQTEVQVEGEGDVIVGYKLENGILTLTKGKLDDEHIYLAGPLTYTTNVGALTLPSGQSNATVGQKGDTIRSLLQSILAKEQEPTITKPSVNSLRIINGTSGTDVSSVEVGTTITPNVSATFYEGKYSYGPATGITVSGGTFVDSLKVSKTIGSGNASASTSYDPVKFGDGTGSAAGDVSSYSVTVTFNHGAGATPKTNLGKNSTKTAAIAAGSVTKTASISCYRNMFYGSTANKAALTSAAVRGLAGKRSSAAATVTATLAVGGQRVVIAVPSNRTVSSILDVSNMNMEVLSAFAKTTVAVAGATAGQNLMNYIVYTLELASPATKAANYTVVIK